MNLTDKCRELINLAEKATPGPWCFRDSIIGNKYVEENPGIFVSEETVGNDPNVKFVVASDPTTVTEICEAYLDLVGIPNEFWDCTPRIKELESRVQELEAALEQALGQIKDDYVPNPLDGGRALIAKLKATLSKAGVK